LSGALSPFNPKGSQILVLIQCRCVGCAGAASAYPLQSWIFAQLVNVIALPNQLLAHASAHWALMFFILGIGAGVAYFTLGWSSTTISHVSLTNATSVFEEMSDTNGGFKSNVV
jgi:hypothetical protein